MVVIGKMEDTFMELIVHKYRFRGESSFKTYLFRIARNKALNAIKKNKRYEQLDRDIEDIKRLEDTISSKKLDSKKEISYAEFLERIEHYFISASNSISGKLFPM